MDRSRALRILLVDDCKIVQACVRAVLGGEPDVEVVGEAGTGEAALALASQAAPDMILMDLVLPELSGIETMRRLQSSLPGVPIIVLSAHNEPGLVAEAIAAGALGYLSKSCNREELLRAVRSVAAGGSYLSPEVATVVIRDYRRIIAPATNAAHVTLSPREREVLRLIADGLSARAIASTLGISPRSVGKHRAQISEKMGLRSIAELTKYAIREGLTVADKRS